MPAPAAVAPAAPTFTTAAPVFPAAGPAIAEGMQAPAIQALFDAAAPFADQLQAADAALAPQLDPEAPSALEVAEAQLEAPAPARDLRRARHDPAVAGRHAGARARRGRPQPRARRRRRRRDGLAPHAVRPAARAQAPRPHRARPPHPRRRPARARRRDDRLRGRRRIGQDPVDRPPPAAYAANSDLDVLVSPSARATAALSRAPCSGRWRRWRVMETAATPRPHRRGRRAHARRDRHPAWSRRAMRRASARSPPTCVRPRRGPRSPRYAGARPPASACSPRSWSRRGRPASSSLTSTTPTVGAVVGLRSPAARRSASSAATTSSRAPPPPPTPAAIAALVLA